MDECASSIIIKGWRWINGKLKSSWADDWNLPSAWSISGWIAEVQQIFLISVLLSFSDVTKKWMAGMTRSFWLAYYSTPPVSSSPGRNTCHIGTPRVQLWPFSFMRVRWSFCTIGFTELCTIIIFTLATTPTTIPPLSPSQLHVRTFALLWFKHTFGY